MIIMIIIIMIISILMITSIILVMIPIMIVFIRTLKSRQPQQFNAFGNAFGTIMHITAKDVMSAFRGGRVVTVENARTITKQKVSK